MSLNGIPNAAMLAQENVWVDAGQYRDAERQYYESLARARANANANANPARHNNNGNPTSASPVSSLVTEIAQARQKIINFMTSGEIDTSSNSHLLNRVHSLENENADLKKRLTSVENQLEEILQKVLRVDPSSNSSRNSLEFNLDSDALKKFIHAADVALNDSLSAVPDVKTALVGKGVSPQACKAFEEEKQKAMLKIIKVIDETVVNWCQISSSQKQESGKVEGQKMNNGSADDDDVDLFGSDEETEEEIRVKEERLKAYAEKKSKKPGVIAKSSILLDVKPWDDETDMKSMEVAVRKIALDGLVWGASKLVPLAYGIKKLQIVAVVEDDKVSIDALQEQIEELTDLVQSVDIAAFNKL